MNVDGIWDQIEAFWKLRDVSRLKQLPSGANSKDLEALKKLFPVTLPDSLIQSLRRHDGDSGCTILDIDNDAFSLLSGCAEIKETYLIMRDCSMEQWPCKDIIDYRITPPKEGWSPEWIPFWNLNGDIHGVIDLRRDAKYFGSIIGVYPEAGEVSFWADSFEHFLEWSLHQLITSGTHNYVALMEIQSQ